LIQNITDDSSPSQKRATTSVLLEIRSGEKDVSIVREENVVVALYNYPSVVAERCMMVEGEWYFEVEVQEATKKEAIAKQIRENFAVVGVVDKPFFGSSTEFLGVGDDSFSWGLDNLGKTSVKPAHWIDTHTKYGPLPEGPKSQGMVIGCAFDLGKKCITWFWVSTDVVLTAKLENVNIIHGLSPAISIFSGVKAEINFGDKPFYLPVPPGYKPVNEWKISK